jgi:RNA polymerase sigma-70 factor, ECF subfamily
MLSTMTARTLQTDDSDDSHQALKRSQEEQLFYQARLGDRDAFAQLVQRYRERLKLLVSVRIDHRVIQRLDDSDVIQEVCLRLTQDADRTLAIEQEATNANESNDADESIPSPYLWLRRLAIWTLADMHRKHLGVKQRDPRREVPLHAMLSASSMDVAKLLIASETRPLDAMVRAERERELERLLEQLEPLDREILMLRHGEQLSRSETAEVLNISIAAAAKRYTRALARIREQMKEWES